MAFLAAGGSVSDLFGKLGDVLPDGFDLPTRGPKGATFQPQLFAFMQAGGNLDDIRVSRGGKRGKGAFKLADGTTVSRSETVKIGKERFAIGEKTRDIFRKTFERAQQEQVGQTQKNFDLIFGKDGPQFLKDRISNRPQQIRDAFGPAVSRGIQQAIGAAAPTGTLTTDAVLQRVSAPLAFRAESQFQRAEDVRNAQELGLSGVPGFGQGFGADPSNFLSPQSLPFLQNLGAQAFQTGAFAPQFANAQSNQQAKGFRAGLFSSAAGQAAGGGFGGGF